MDLQAFIGQAMPVPFLDRGRTYDGWDCWGLVVCAYRDVLGISLPDGGDLYSDAQDVEQVSRAIASGPRQAWRKLAADEAAIPLDAVLMNAVGHPVHVGLALDARWMIHCFKGGNTVRERIINPLAPNRIEGVYRYGI